MSDGISPVPTRKERRSVSQLAALNIKRLPRKRNCDADLELETVLPRRPTDPPAPPPLSPACAAILPNPRPPPPPLAMPAPRLRLLRRAGTEDGFRHDDAGAR